MAANTILTTRPSSPRYSQSASPAARRPRRRAPRITGHAPGQQVGNIVGGGTGASLQGGGDDLVIRYNQPGAGGGGVGWEQPGRFARFASARRRAAGGVLHPRACRDGRGAWLTGGGDNTEVAYTSPYQRR